MLGLWFEIEEQVEVPEDSSVHNEPLQNTCKTINTGETIFPWEMQVV